MRGLLVLLVIVVVPGCGGGAAQPSGTTSVPANVAVEPEPEPVTRPEGYVEMQARDVVSNAEATAVLLFDPVTRMVLPIFIGGTEGFSIQLRLRGEPFRRPLTHDLLDAAVTELGGEIVKVQIDQVVENTFHGSVYVRAGSKVRRLDARPSDAIALAIGNRVPIYVAQPVIDDAGVSVDEILRQADAAPDPSAQ